jgi:hypothetical protein
VAIALPKYGFKPKNDVSPSLWIASPIHQIFSFAFLVEVCRGDVWFSPRADSDRVIFSLLSSSRRVFLPLRLLWPKGISFPSNCPTFLTG